MLDLELKFTKVFWTQLPLSPAQISLMAPYLPSSLDKAAQGRQMEFMAGRFCAVEAAKLIGHNIEPPPMGDNREPLWPDPLIGSISHTKKWALAGVALKSQVRYLGLDLETIISQQKIETIRKMVAHSDDLKIVDTQSQLVDFTILFSAKESLYKALYPHCQCYIGFQEARMNQLDRDKGIFQLELISENPKLLQFNQKYQGNFWIKDDLVITAIEI